MVQAADLHVLLGGDSIELADFQAVGQDQLDAALRAGGGLAAQLLDGFDESAVDAAARFDFEEAAVGRGALLPGCRRRRCCRP